MLGSHARSMQPLRTWVLRLTWTGFLAGMVFLAAGWLSVLLSPRPVSALATRPLVSTSLVTLDDALRVFGRVVAATPQLLGLELTGVYAARRNKGFAIFNSQSGPRSVAVGQEVQPGLRLVAASARYVTLSGNGSEWRLELKSDAAAGKSRRPAGAGGK